MMTGVWHAIFRSVGNENSRPAALLEISFSLSTAGESGETGVKVKLLVAGEAFTPSNYGVGKLGKGTAQVNAVVETALQTIIDERAATLSMTRSKFAGLVFAWWEAQGCPAVSPADEAVQILKRGKSGKK